MSSMFTDGFPGDFSPELLKTAWDLRPIGCNELAWPYPVVLQAIAALVERNYVILGGDVYRQMDRHLKPAHDGWSIPKREQVEGASDNWALYVQAGAVKARKYIDIFHVRNGPDYWFVLVVADEAGFTRLFC